MLMVGGILRLGEIVHFFFGVCDMSWDCVCCRCGLGLLGAVADLELPIAGNW